MCFSCSNAKQKKHHLRINKRQLNGWMKEKVVDVEACGMKESEETITQKKLD